MKNIIIAGAGKGIGLEIAKLLAPEFNLITISRNLTDDLKNLNTQFYKLTLSKETVFEIIDLPDEIHGLIYCPGSINLKPITRLSISDFEKDFDQNVLGAVGIIKYVLPNLKKSKDASIVLFSTVAVKLGMAFHASVAASKGAIEGLTKSLAAELAGSRIRVNAIAPSLIKTSMSEFLLNTEEKRNNSAKMHPLQRIGNPQEIAKLAEYLISENSSWITGQIIGIDGGLGSLK
ncbi:MAG: SDR family oxidoreductase [Saprospiraceae bacterium]